MIDKDLFAKKKPFMRLSPIAAQQKMVSEIETIEFHIAELETQIAAIPNKKEAVLKQYL